MARRGENIFKRKDGRWEARITNHSEEGKRSYRSLYGRTYTEVKAKKEEYFIKYGMPDTPIFNKRLPFSVAAERWLSGVCSSVKESTYTRYHRIVYSYIHQYFNEYAVTDLTASSVNSFKNALLTNGGKKGKGLSEKTVSDILSVVKLILTHAAREGYPVTNAGLIRNPRRKKRDISVIPEDELKKLEETLILSDDRLSAGILLALHTGIRNGEVCGLKWGDFDFRSRTVRINRTVERIANLDVEDKRKTKVVITEPKTEASKREIPLPYALCEYLKLKKGEDSCYLLTNTQKPAEPHTLYVRFERFLRHHGFERYTFHSLRHTFATRGVAAGFDVKSLSEILGHSDVTTTLRCYVHPSVEQKRRLMEAMFDSGISGRKYGS